MKKILFSFIIFTILLLIGCNISNGKTGGLCLSFTLQDSKTLLPAISMIPVSYGISGRGPDGAEFELKTPETGITIPDLVFGDWSLSVSAFNNEETVIGYGEGQTTVFTGETVPVHITVTPLMGSGTLDLEINWNAEDTQYPTIAAELIPAEGEALDLDFIITGNNKGTFISNSISTGYYTLSVKLLDGNPDKITPILTMGAVEVVRIIKDEVTSGTFDFTEINKPGGSIRVNISSELADPIPVTLNGLFTNLITKGVMEVSASVPEGTETGACVWYINSKSISTGETCKVSGLAKGIYRLDVTVFSYDGKRAGSASHIFHVIDPPTSAWQYFREIIIDNIANLEQLTAYQILITLDTQSLISAGKMKSDGADIRFFDAGFNYLSYWIESGIQNECGINQPDTKIWVKVPAIAANSTKSIYMKYGNPNASAQSNIKTTFILGDDFNDNSLDTSLWRVGETNQGSAIETNGRLVHNSPASDPQSDSYLISTNYLTGPVIVEARFKKGGYAYRGFQLKDDTDTNSAGIYISDCCSVDFGVTSGGVNSSVIAEPNFWSREFNPEYYLTIIHKPDGTFTIKGTVPAFEPGGPKNWENTFTQSIPVTTPLLIKAYEGIWRNAWWLWERYEDDIRVRKYTAIEPITVPGEEIAK